MSSSSIRFIKILLKKLTCSIATPSLVLARYKMKEVTNFLKDNNLFRKTSFFIHDTKSNIQDKLKNSFEKLLRQEDNLKFIDDDKDKFNKRDNK